MRSIMLILCIVLLCMGIYSCNVDVGGDNEYLQVVNVFEVIISAVMILMIIINDDF